MTWPYLDSRIEGSRILSHFSNSHHHVNDIHHDDTSMRNDVMPFVVKLHQHNNTAGPAMGRLG